MAIFANKPSHLLSSIRVHNLKSPQTHHGHAGPFRQPIEKASPVNEEALLSLLTCLHEGGHVYVRP